MGQVYSFWDSTRRYYIFNFATKEKFCGQPDLWFLSRILEATKIHASTNGVPTVAVPIISCGLDQRIWREIVKLLRDISAHADEQIVVYTLDKNGVHAMSAEGDADF